MKKTKKIIAIVLTFLLILPVILTGCTSSESLSGYYNNNKNLYADLYAKNLVDEYVNEEGNVIINTDSEYSISKHEFDMLLEKIKVPYKEATKVFNKNDLKTDKFRIPIGNKYMYYNFYNNNIYLKADFLGYSGDIQFLGFNKKQFIDKVINILENEHNASYEEKIKELKGMQKYLIDSYICNNNIIYTSNPNKFKEYINNKVYDFKNNNKYDPIIIDNYIFNEDNDSTLYEFLGKTVKENGILYSSDKKVLLKAPVTNETFTVPSSVNKIASYAFKNNNNLRTLNIPNSVNYVGYNIVSNCDSIKAINIQHKQYDTKHWNLYNYDSSINVTYCPDLDFNNMPQPDYKPISPIELYNLTYYVNLNLKSVLYNKYLNTIAQHSTVTDKLDNFAYDLASNVKNNVVILNRSNINSTSLINITDSNTKSIVEKLKTFPYDFELVLIDELTQYQLLKEEYILRNILTREQITNAFYQFESQLTINNEYGYNMLNVLYSLNTYDLVKAVNSVNSYRDFTERNYFAIDTYDSIALKLVDLS